jgi:PAS domain S-box-containing protein
MEETLNNFDFNDIIDNLPFGIMIVDKNRLIRFLNQKMINNFGNITNEFLEYSSIKIYKPDILEKVNEVFETGSENSSLLSPIDKRGKLTFQSINYYPLKDINSNVENVLVVISDNNDSNLWQKEFNLLFENVPVFISIVDRKYKIVRANQRFRNTFGNNFSVFNSDPNKRKIELSTNSTALSFFDGDEHTDTVVAYNNNKEKLHLIVTSLPFIIKDGKVNLVMEISTDITEISKLQDQINNAHDFYAHLIESSTDGIMAIDNKNRIQIINSAARKILGFDNKRKPKISTIKEMLPQVLFAEANEDGIIASNIDFTITDTSGNSIPLRFNAYEIRNKKKTVGKVAFFRDLRKIKKLEKRIYDAENLAFNSTIKMLTPSFKGIFKQHNQLLENFNELILNDSVSDSTKQLWEASKIQFNFIEKLVNNFIDSSSEKEIVLSKINFTDIIKQISVEHEFLFNYYNINFDFKIKDDANIILSDEYSIHCILCILIMHSLESVKEFNSNPEISILISKKNKLIRIEVKNNGRPLQNLDNIRLTSLNKIQDIKLEIFTAAMISEKLKANFSTNYGDDYFNRYIIELNELANY